MVDMLLLSVDEPQLDRCVAAINNQTVPFTKIVHINGVVPQSAAYNRGMKMMESEWFMWTAGDVILYPNAVEIAMEFINKERDKKLCSYFFYLVDAFLEIPIWGVSCGLTAVHQKEEVMDKLCNDRILGQTLNSQGWYGVKTNKAVGTHFENPDEFQVFRRFFILGRKFKGVFPETLKTRLNWLNEKSNNPLYQLAIKAIDFSKVNGRYPGSHNIEYDRKKYEEFKNTL